MKVKTADLCDKFSDRLNITEPVGFRDFGGRKSFYGKIYTVKCFEDNSFVRKVLETNGEGKVLVVDGGASMRCALMGDMLGDLAVKNQWSGIIVNGCIRDSAAMARLDLGVKALNTIPLKSLKRDVGEVNVTLHIAGTDIVPGEFIYCDEDGIVISKEELAI